MAYMSQEKKKALAPGIKKVLAKYGVKGTLSVDNHSSLVLTLKSGKIDLMGQVNAISKEQSERRYPNFKWTPSEYCDVNHYHLDWWDGYPETKAFLTELVAAMNVGNWDKSDIMTDYFDVGFFVHINVGKWNKHYVYEG